jgi:hypothetical protein
MVLFMAIGLCFTGDVTTTLVSPQVPPSCGRPSKGQADTPNLYEKIDNKNGKVVHYGFA